jgi:Leucine-rich repeat (LRR) protein
LDLRDFGNLEALDCSNNKLTDMDLSNCKKLKSISCHGNQLSSTDFLKSLPNLDKVGLLGIVEPPLVDKKSIGVAVRAGFSLNILEVLNSLVKSEEITNRTLSKLLIVIEKDKEEEKALIEKLVEVIKNKNIKELKDLVKKGITDIVNKKDKQENAPLHYAVAGGDEEIVKMLLEVEGIDINTLNVRKLSALHVVVSNSKDENSKKIINLLLEGNANANIKDLGGNTPLHFVAEENNLEVFELLVKWKGDINEVNEDGWTVLHSAASGVINKKEDWNIIKFMLEKGVNIDVKTKNGLEVEDIFLKVDYSYLAHYEELIKDFLENCANQELVTKM